MAYGFPAELKTWVGRGRELPRERDSALGSPRELRPLRDPEKVARSLEEWEGGRCRSAGSRGTARISKVGMEGATWTAEGVLFPGTTPVQLGAKRRWFLPERRGGGLRATET